MRSVSINCWLADKIRHSTGQPDNQCNFCIWQAFGEERHQHIAQPLNTRTCVLSGNRWHQRVIRYASNFCHQPLLHATGHQSFLQPFFEILTRIFRTFYVIITTTMTMALPILDRIQTHHPTIHLPYNNQKSRKRQCLYASISSVNFN